VSIIYIAPNVKEHPHDGKLAFLLFWLYAKRPADAKDIPYTWSCSSLTMQNRAHCITTPAWSIRRKNLRTFTFGHKEEMYLLP
jgi:hypothetical protein